MTEESAIARTEQPATVESLTADLARLGVSPGMTLLVHSSLSALGYVVSGAPSVILALEAALGERGTLAMPAHSADLSDPAGWVDPPVPLEWLDTIRAHMPPFDPSLTPTRGMGMIAETFRSQAGTHRSHHPAQSFAARGPTAAAITADHALTPAFGERSPLARLYDHDAWVLLLGVGHGSNTSLHLAETRAAGDAPRLIPHGAPLSVGGVRRWVRYEDLDYDATPFPQIGIDFARDTGLERTGRVALATARLMPQRALVDYGVHWLKR
jgi:aminoglycoside 3-N-acetyltransferase